jgi:hypothetical protein
MLVVGLGKADGAVAFHHAAARLGYRAHLEAGARLILGRAPVVGGVALVEDARHRVVRIEGIRAEALVEREREVFLEAERLMPRIPFDEIDLLVVDEMGKDKSGSGMDPNVIGRPIHGYSSLLADLQNARPRIRRLFVRDLTPASHGNVMGLGLADVTTTRLVRAMNTDASYANAFASLSLQGVKIPIHFPADQQAIAFALATACPGQTAEARILRIADTLSLETMEISEALLRSARSLGVEPVGPPGPMSFDAQGNLPPFSGRAVRSAAPSS